MNTTNMPDKTIHHGNNIKSLRELTGMNQEALADAMGVSQQKISALEQKEQIDRAQLEEVAKALKMPVEAIENYSNKEAVNIITNHFTFSDTATQNYSHSGGTSSRFDGDNNGGTTNNINPIEELVKAIEENKKLYQQLLQSEKEKYALLEKTLNKL